MIDLANNLRWTAICRGAVVHELSKQNLSAQLGVRVEARIARMSYGILYREFFDASKHLEADKIWSEEEHKYMADNQMKWFLKEVTDTTTQI